MPTPPSSPFASLAPRALNVAASGDGAVAPEWIELIPAGPLVEGLDGRRWSNPDPAAVIAASRLDVRPLALDWEHATEVRGAQGLEAPAAGWIDALEVRDGATWGRVGWTPRAAEQVRCREYRFVSPTFTYDKPSGRIVRLTGAGLTNQPNLRLTALNREQETSLDLASQLREALGLPATADEAGIVAAVREAKATNRPVDLTAYAPRVELATAINRAETAEKALATIQAGDREAKIEAALNTAQSEGKITPASRAEYLALCKSEGGLEIFERLAATLPVVASAGATGAEKKPDRSGDPVNLTDEQKAVCRQLGQDEAAFAKSLKEA